METRTFAAVDGLSLAGYVWHPDAPPKAVLQVAHGMAEHARRYDRVARRFAAAGWLVVAHDHRGHGCSVPDGEPLGHMADDDAWTKAVTDVHRVNRAIAEDHAGLPIVLLAHSMGSFMAQSLLADWPDDFAAVALSGSNGRPPPIAHAGRLVTRFERLRLGPRGTSSLLQKLSFGAYNKGFEGRTEFDWLSRDPAEVDAYVADPLCGFAISVQSWLDFLDALVGLTAPTRLARFPKNLPLYVFSGDHDPVGERGRGIERLVEALRQAGLRRVEQKLYPGARHETLNETNRDEVVSDLLAWAERAIAPGDDVG